VGGAGSGGWAGGGQTRGHVIPIPQSAAGTMNWQQFDIQFMPISQPQLREGLPLTLNC